ncbi:hypothetical protein E2C01_014237 [Portunus trituberculatus]|uniref:Uncharacterized protein n=1 Tax=Portunus trituberculatus TaxID=210409 RepID=A0A5B7DIN1_PORTR|nr:hypothetical protein [Portunus trituberculatus]
MAVPLRPRTRPHLLPRPASCAAPQHLPRYKSKSTPLFHVASPSLPPHPGDAFNISPHGRLTTNLTRFM